MSLLKNSISALFALTIAVSFGFYLGKGQSLDRAGQVVDQKARSSVHQTTPPRGPVGQSAALKKQTDPASVDAPKMEVSAAEPTPIDTPTQANPDAQWTQSHEHDVLPIEEPEWLDETAEDPEFLGDGQALQEQKIRSIEEQLEVQERDPDWANKIEHEFNQTFAEAILENSSILDMDCRTSICKFEILHSNTAAAHQFVSAFLNKPDLNLHGQNVFVHESRDINGGLNSVYYYSK